MDSLVPVYLPGIHVEMRCRGLYSGSNKSSKVNSSPMIVLTIAEIYTRNGDVTKASARKKNGAIISQIIPVTMNRKLLALLLHTNPHIRLAKLFENNSS